jgi:endonuclease YncB( thermonuclease family)
VKFDNCTFIPTEWADGDSFRIKTAAGIEHTIRLYGADCMEWHINDEADERRLRAQRRYFGITEVAPKAKDAIEMAKGFGEAAAKKTATLLKNPFTVHTRFSKAPGNGEHPRIYAFVECADGKDLASELVKSGLARAFGVYADGPGERSAQEYEDTLDDLELQSAKRGVGIWSKTDWDKLPIERRAQRKDEQDADLAIDNGKLKPGETLNPNTAARDDLMKLPGIREFLADRIIETREDAAFEKPEDLMRVPGIKQKTLDELRQHLDFAKP